jgi:hypothetical protein
VHEIKARMILVANEGLSCDPIEFSLVLDPAMIQKEMKGSVVAKKTRKILTRIIYIRPTFELSTCRIQVRSIIIARACSSREFCYTFVECMLFDGAFCGFFQCWFLCFFGKSIYAILHFTNTLA